MIYVIDALAKQLLIVSSVLQMPSVMIQAHVLVQLIGQEHTVKHGMEHVLMHVTIHRIPFAMDQSLLIVPHAVPTLTEIAMEVVFVIPNGMVAQLVMYTLKHATQNVPNVMAH
jgi:hypothetical protein